MSDPFSFLGINASNLLAGAAGGIVKAIFKPNGDTIKFLSTMIAGALTANYLTPVVVEMTGIGASPGTGGGLAFVIGFSAQVTTHALLKRIEKKIGGAS